MRLLFGTLGLFTGLSVLVLLVYRPTLRLKCPHCGQTVSIDKIHRPALIKLLFFYFPTGSYRCLDCLRVFVLLGNGR